MNVTIVIPSFNEERYIEATVEAALNVTPNVIVVDDNSNDLTQSIVGRYPVNLLIKPISIPKGKSSSINYASQYVDTEFTIIIDADTVIESSHDIISKLNGGADLVGCEVGIFKDGRLLTELEHHEYDFVIGTVRPLLNRIGYLNNVSGAYLGIRTELLQANPVPSNVNGEDMYLTQIGIINDWIIELSTSKASTYGIPNVKALLTQRARWITGLLSTVRATGRKVPLIELAPCLYNVLAPVAGIIGGILLTGSGIAGLAITLGAWYVLNVYITKSFWKGAAYLGYAQLNTLSFLLSPIIGRTWKVNR